MGVRKQCTGGVSEHKGGDTGREAVELGATRFVLRRLDISDLKQDKCLFCVQVCVCHLEGIFKAFC